MQFVERLVDLADQAAAGHRADDVLRRPPAELLGDLEAERLRPLGVERPQVDVDEAPAVLERHLGAETIDLVIGALDADDLGAVDAGAEDLGPLQVGGHEDVAVEAGGGGVGGHAVGQVAGRGAADGREAELAGLAQGHRHDAVLERQRREVDGVVLDPELLDAQLGGQAIGPDAAASRRPGGRPSARRPAAGTPGSATCYCGATRSCRG